MLSESRPAACDAVADDLAAVDEQYVLSPAVGAHVESCLRCQAEVAGYRRLRRTLRSLADHPVIVSPQLEGDILARLDVADGRPAVRVPAAAAATIGSIAAAAGVIVLAARHRRVLRPAG